MASRAIRRTVYAVTRALEIVSEASRGLPEAGNVYRHEYEAVDDALVWHAVQHGLTERREIAEVELQQCQD